jgi:hypothetical protein
MLFLYSAASVLQVLVRGGVRNEDRDGGDLDKRKVYGA